MEKHSRFLSKVPMAHYGVLVRQEEVLLLQLLFLSSSVSHGWWPTLMDRKNHNDLPAYCHPLSCTLFLEMKSKTWRLRTFPDRGELQHQNHSLQKQDFALGYGLKERDCGYCFLLHLVLSVCTYDMIPPMGQPRQKDLLCEFQDFFVFMQFCAVPWSCLQLGCKVEFDLLKVSWGKKKKKEIYI